MDVHKKLVIDREIKGSLKCRGLGGGFEECVPVRVIYNRIFIFPKAAGAVQIDDKKHAISGQEIPNR
ncbi:hypothetical protein D3H65_09230 [Paraflavitalea soli]|uniref:Uncharacterized protein n=1 Tax=Paraflavitalea soli TaxID=2315862 RepID=A0A3B7MLH3_9BACT|nr:hypothetical protein [Paraflavitalea soli]AXY74143.1 hypothetical protein D3H65_09230 [Paraflavitalea soli]